MIIEDHPSPNFNERRDGKKPVFLILHYTDTRDVDETLSYLMSPEREVSAHYLVAEDGRILRLVDEEYRAWHAGKSYWAGDAEINSSSIGIEIQNTGHSFGFSSFPDVQMKAVRDLCLDIIRRHNILPQHVLGHSDIAPGRKTDPGPLFPWRWLASEGVGLWPEDTLATVDIDKALVAYGYNPDVDLDTRLAAFQLHFDPEAYDGGIATPRTMSRLANLLKLI